MTKVQSTPSTSSSDSNASVEFERRHKIGDFFRSCREAAGLSLDTVAKELELDSTEVLTGYEAGHLSIPLEDIFALTNLLNVPPEDVMDLIHSLYMHGAR